MDSVALAEHVLGQKQYEMVNHLSNVQEVITDKKYWKDTNGDGDRDEAKAVVQSVYDYYPFARPQRSWRGQLMAGRSILDTTGMCVTRTRLQEIPVYKWVPGAGMASRHRCGPWFQEPSAQSVPLSGSVPGGCCILVISARFEPPVASHRWP